MIRKLSQWYQRHVNDHYVKQAMKHGYRARSAFKLIELHQRYKILQKGQNVLELGACPGAWTQVAVKETGSTAESPLVLSVDQCELQPVPGALFASLDVAKESSIAALLKLHPRQFDVLLSDLAPNFSGDRDLDCAATLSLNLAALAIAKVLLRHGGTFLLKMLHGYDEPAHFVWIKLEIPETHSEHAAAREANCLA